MDWSRRSDSDKVRHPYCLPSLKIASPYWQFIVHHPPAIVHAMARPLLFRHAPVQTRIRLDVERREDRVQSRYLLVRRSDGWLIAVDAAMLLICGRRKAALRAIREAIAYEVASSQPLIPREQSRAHDRIAGAAVLPRARTVGVDDAASGLLHYLAREVPDHLYQPLPHRR
jgi:hypothetical protein